MGCLVKYKTEADEVNEIAMLALVAHAKPGRRFVLTKGDFGPYDGVIYNESGDPTAIVECKRRNYWRYHFPDYAVDVSKIRILREIGAELGLTPILCVAWADQTAMINVGRLQPEVDYRVATGGRRDRRDRWDIEPQALISTVHKGWVRL